MNYGSVDLNNPIYKEKFIKSFNLYLKKKNNKKITNKIIKNKLENQTVQSLKNSLKNLQLSDKGNKDTLIKRLEKDILFLKKNYDL